MTTGTETTAKAPVGSSPAEISPASDAILLLRRFTEAAGLTFDPVAADRSLRLAERDIPPTVARAARKRLAQAAEAVGIQLQSLYLSIREAYQAVAPELPLALLSVTTAGTARWFLLVDAAGGKGRFHRLSTGDEDVSLSEEEFARVIGVSDADAVVEWQIAQPIVHHATPESAHSEGGHDHAGHHGPSPTKRLWQLIEMERRDIALVVLYSIGVGVLSLAIPVTAMAVVNTAALATLVQQLIVLCLALFLSLTFAALLRCLPHVPQLNFEVEADKIEGSWYSWQAEQD